MTSFDDTERKYAQAFKKHYYLVARLEKFGTKLRNKFSHDILLGGVLK